ncbi:MAG: hypothetical protein WC985_08115 [Thermoplasmata archaeon]
MADIREKVEEDRGLIKKIQLHIPGYAGYRRREDIRQADNILRIYISDQVKTIRGSLENIRDQRAADGMYQGLQTIGNSIFTLQGIEAKTRHAEQGYSGFSPAIRVEEGELDKLYEYDYAMLEALDRAAACVPMIQQASDPKSFDVAMKAFRDSVQAFDAAWGVRMEASTGTMVR